MNKTTRKIVTFMAALVLAVSTTIAAFAAAENANNNSSNGKNVGESSKVTVDATFFILNPKLPIGQIEYIVQNPLEDSSANLWTKGTGYMKGTITYDPADVVNYKYGKYITSEDFVDCITVQPDATSVQRALDDKNWEFEFSENHKIIWTVIKFNNGDNIWHVDGVIVPKEDEEPTTEEVTTEEPTTEEPTTEEPTTVEPTTVEPTTQEPTTEEPTTVEPTTQEPTTEEATTEEVTTQEPTTEEATTQEPTTVEPTTQEPTTEEVTTEEVTTQEPTTEEVTTVEPTTEEATTEEETTAAGVVIKPDQNPLDDGQSTATNEKSASGVVINPNEEPLATGDNTVVWLFAAIAIIAAGALVAVNATKTEE
ncbi:MAG: hypothetical protein GX225_05515 [Clostridiales bacterium]|nr:hypothetical protein [Clostridiales bacterium]